MNANIEELRPPGCVCPEWHRGHDEECKVSVRLRMWMVQRRLHPDKPITGPLCDPFTSKLFQAVVNDELLMAQAKLLFNDDPTNEQRTYYAVALTVSGLWEEDKVDADGLHRFSPEWPLADAPKIDLQQVAMNGGPPCFALLVGDGRERYCGRALRWRGHGVSHEFVSADDALARARCAALASDGLTNQLA